MNSPNYPPPGGPYGPPPGQPYGHRPPQTPPGGQPFGGPPPQGPPFGAPPPPGQPFGGPPPPGQPFGGPPPQGQPFGGPGVPSGPPAGGFGPPPPGGPGGPPPAYPTPPPPAPIAKPNNAGKFVKIGLGVVVLAVVAVFTIMNWGTSASSAEVGDCIKVNEAGITDADVEKIDCTDPAAAYKVGATFDSSSATCPGGSDSAYVSYTQTGGRRSSSLTLCLILNATEGDCYEEGTSVDTKVECTDPNATFQVAKVLTDSADPAACPEGVLGVYVYPEPKPGMVQCLGEPLGGASGT